MMNVDKTESVAAELPQHPLWSTIHPEEVQQSAHYDGVDVVLPPSVLGNGSSRTLNIPHS